MLWKERKPVQRTGHGEEGIKWKTEAAVIALGQPENDITVYSDVACYLRFSDGPSRQLQE
jgi:hypothetical protein